MKSIITAIFSLIFVASVNAQAAKPTPAASAATGVADANVVCKDDEVKTAKAVGPNAKVTASCGVKPSPVTIAKKPVVTQDSVMVKAMANELADLKAKFANSTAPAPKCIGGVYTIVDVTTGTIKQVPKCGDDELLRIATQGTIALPVETPSRIANFRDLGSASAVQQQSQQQSVQPSNGTCVVAVAGVPVREFKEKSNTTCKQDRDAFEALYKKQCQGKTGTIEGDRDCARKLP